MGIHRLIPLLLLVSLAIAEDTQPLDFPLMAPTVAAILDRDYYDHSRFKPRIMVERGLRALETAEVSIDTQWQDEAITINIAGKTSTLPAPEPKDMNEAMDLLEQVRLAVTLGDFTPTQRRNLAYAMLNGALLSLDPHTLIFPPEPASEFAEDIAGEFYGIGAFLDMEEGVITIDRVMPGLPADRAGLEDKDIILAVDGERTVGLSLEQAVRRIKGPRGTAVTLTIERKDVEKPMVVPITRDLVQVITMRSFKDDGVGYVRMDEFNNNTARDLYRTLSDLQKDGPLKGFVLDLRYNGGGLLEQAKLVSDFFLPKNVEIVRTVTLGGEPQIFKSSSQMLLDAPMLVLTSSGSASAAEITAGALQCNDRAVVIGETTFGKGSVQSIRPLRDNSRLKLTIQEYQLPGGVSIQDVGVTPEIKLVRHAIKEDGSVDLLSFTGVHEADDEFALSGHDNYKRDSNYELGWLSEYQTKEQLRASSISSREFHPDQEATLVIGLLKNAVAQPEAAEKIAALQKEGANFRQTTLELLQQPLKQQAEAEAAALTQALAKQMPAITWGNDTAADAGALSLAFNGPNTLAAGDKAALSFALTNKSDHDLGRLYGLVQADKYSPLWEEEVIFGAVPANGTTTGTLIFPVPARAYAGEERFTLDIYRDGHKEVLASLPVRINITDKPRPHFSYEWQLLAADGEPAKPEESVALKPGEQGNIRMTLVNDGDATSMPVYLYVFKDNDPYVQLGEGRFKLDPLDAGKSVSVTVPVTVLSEARQAGKMTPFSGSQIKLLVRAEERFPDNEDAHFRSAIYHTLKIPVNQAVTGKGIRQPILKIVSCETTGSNHANVRVHIGDDNAKYIALFQDDDKIDLKPATALTQDDYIASIPLKDGVNSIRFLVTDEDDVSEFLPLRLWGKDGTPKEDKPVVKQSAPSTDAIP